MVLQQHQPVVAEKRFVADEEVRNSEHAARLGFLRDFYALVLGRIVVERACERLAIERDRCGRGPR